MTPRVRARLAQLLTAALALGLWFSAPPEGLSLPAWRLFAIFAAAIFSTVAGALPILTASVLAVAAAVLTGTVAPEDAYAGFGNSTILLIVVAFLVANAVVKSGLGTRAGHAIVSRFGRSTLGLSSFDLRAGRDRIRAGVPEQHGTVRRALSSQVHSLAEAAGATPDNPSRRRVGAFLMYSGVASLRACRRRSGSLRWPGIPLARRSRGTSA